jgi:hypothetical protein
VIRRCSLYLMQRSYIYMCVCLQLYGALHVPAHGAAEGIAGCAAQAV